MLTNFKSTNKKQTPVSNLTLIALLTAITCILAPFSIFIPFSPVPISLTNLVLYISVYILTFKQTTYSYTVYLLLGLVGLPVFSGFSGGFGKLFGPTGGYLFGFFPLIWISSYFICHYKTKKHLHFIGMILGTIICYLFGTLWLSYQLSISFLEALAIGVTPYIIGDFMKILFAIYIGPKIVSRLPHTQN